MRLGNAREWAKASVALVLNPSANGPLADVESNFSYQYISDLPPPAHALIEKRPRPTPQGFPAGCTPPLLRGLPLKLLSAPYTYADLRFLLNLILIGLLNLGGLSGRVGCRLLCLVLQPQRGGP